jgi:hypothetical protein
MVGFEVVFQGESYLLDQAARDRTIETEQNSMIL